MDLVLMSLVKFLILFVLIFIFATFLILLGRKYKIIAVFSMYCFICSLLLLVIDFNLIDKITFYDGVKEGLRIFVISFDYLFAQVYLLFVDLICSICALFTSVEPIRNFLYNTIFVIGLHAILFLLSLLLFKKKNKSKIEKSRYYD